jgi:hypothetical protein
MTQYKSLDGRCVDPLSLAMKARRGLLLLCLAGLSLTASAGTYYRWVDDQGITHYTAAPPQGIKSEKVTSYNHGSSASAPNAEQKNATDAVAGENPEAQSAPPANLKDPERCAAAKKRADTLQNNNRIRMQSDDGEYRFLSQEEIQEELVKSQQAIEQSC